MDEVDQDRHRALAPCGLSSDPLDLMAVAVDQRNPAAQMLGIASLGLVEHLAHDLGGVLHDAGHQPLAAGRGHGLARASIRRHQDVGRRTGYWAGV